ncbi:Cytochrome b5 domain-containing protein 1 [Aspergillus nanangensis]|uniref:Cytochrome b5 domain-containing protein 1 n=1 Tax=Aspergillus nanangensis TaxID=2582783 RepID=A0AAD4CCE8_ASPNN|nr:Cytochrome b5 domain-containing protein 1 [Aspergillus nanangensis]
MSSLRICDRSEVAQHSSRKSCWVIINQIVYDFTSYVDAHPGGPQAILTYGGRDATEAFEPIHPSDTLEKHIKPESIVGRVKTPRPVQDATRESNAASEIPPRKMRLSSIVNLTDFEVAASERLSARAFAFIRAGADDEKTEQWNRDSWQLVRFRPRILRPIESIDLSTTIMGAPVSVPFFIAPAGGGKLAHSSGEVLMTQAAAKYGVLHWVCNMASCTQEDMAQARVANQTQYWQIYAKADLAVTEKEVRRAIELGYKGFALTVDAIRAGKRSRDLRMAVTEYEATYPEENEDEDDSPMSGGVSAQRGALWSSFDWQAAIKWLRGLTDLPIAIKGIQCWEDAVLCTNYGVHPWLSNHGGRQLEGAPSAVETLIKIRRHAPRVFNKAEVIVDGGVMRGTDVVKAIALGAKGVAIGRAFLYALALGEVGVSKAIQILKSEMETCMSLLGVTRIEDLNVSHVTVRQATVSSHL